MKFNFQYFLSYTLAALFCISCSNENLQNMGVIKKKADQFAVSRQAPLEMPPDMYLRPPKLKKEKENNNLNFDDDKLSIDDILSNEDMPIDNKIIKSSKEKRILKKILNTKAIMLK